MDKVPPAAKPTSQNLLDPGDFPQRAHPGNQVGPPAAEREITLRRPDAPEVEGEHSRTGLGGQTCGQLREAVTGRPGPLARLGEPVSEDYAMAARARSGREVGPGQVPRQGRAAGRSELDTFESGATVAPTIDFRRRFSFPAPGTTGPGTTTAPGPDAHPTTRTCA